MFHLPWEENRLDRKCWCCWLLWQTGVYEEKKGNLDLFIHCSHWSNGILRFCTCSPDSHPMDRDSLYTGRFKHRLLQHGCHQIVTDYLHSKIKISLGRLVTVFPALHACCFCMEGCDWQNFIELTVMWHKISIFVLPGDRNLKSSQ